MMVYLQSEHMMVDMWECRDCGQIWAPIQQGGPYVAKVQAAIDSGCLHPKGLQGTLNARDAALLGILMEKGS